MPTGTTADTTETKAAPVPRRPPAKKGGPFTYGFDPFIDYVAQALYTTGKDAAGNPLSGRPNVDYTGDTEGFGFAHGKTTIDALPPDATPEQIQVRCDHLARLTNPPGRYIVRPRLEAMVHSTSGGSAPAATATEPVPAAGAQEPPADL